jgi:hypothetical protein
VMSEPVAKTSHSLTLELVLKRNSVERLKREKSPLLILDELPAISLDLHGARLSRVLA